MISATLSAVPYSHDEGCGGVPQERLRRCSTRRVAEVDLTPPGTSVGFEGDIYAYWIEISGRKKGGSHSANLSYPSEVDGRGTTVLVTLLPSLLEGKFNQIMAVESRNESSQPSSRDGDYRTGSGAGALGEDTWFER